MTKIVLASQSPRRRELLERMGIRAFSVVVPDVEETLVDGLSPRQTVESISRQKSEAAAPLVGADDIVITADTMVFLGGEKLGKPKDEADAFRMLRSLSGNRHEVCTGVTVRQGERSETFSVTTLVYFRDLTDDEIRSYIASGEPMDKAGSYGVQGLGCLIVERIDGDYYNVIGLPVERLGRVLARFGVKLL